MMGKSIVIVSEQREGRVAPVTYELLGLAQEIRQVRALEVKVVVLGAGAEVTARQIARTTGEAVIAIHNPHLKTYSGELYKELLQEELPRLDPVFVLISQTTQGLDFAPGLALRLKAGCMTGVNAVFREKGDLSFSRAAYNGKIAVDIAPTVKTTVLVVQPGAFRLPKPKVISPGPVETHTSFVKPKKTRSQGLKRVKQGDAGLSEADIIVAAGRGIGKEENLILVKRLAALFPRSAVAGSRPVCDMGWLEYGRQIGLTGATVSPRLYFACGISGAFPHKIGMQGSGFIVAISTDPRAPIFNMADVCIHEDLNDFIPAFIEEYEKRSLAPVRFS